MIKDQNFFRFSFNERAVEIFAVKKSQTHFFQCFKRDSLIYLPFKESNPVSFTWPVCLTNRPCFPTEPQWLLNWNFMVCVCRACRLVQIRHHFTWIARDLKAPIVSICFLSPCFFAWRESDCLSSLFCKNKLCIWFDAIWSWLKILHWF